MLQEKMIDVLKPRYILIFFSVLFIALYSFRIDSVPPIAMDEGWFAFYSMDLFHLNPFSQLHSEIQYKLFCLYPSLCALVFKLTSVSLTAQRAMAVVSGFLGLVGMYQIIRKITPSLWILVLGLFLYTTSNITFVTSRWGRPEGFIFTTLIWCLYYLYKGITENKKSCYAVSGFLSGVMVMLHPFSLTSVVSIAGICIFLNRKQPINILYYFLGASPVFLFFLVNMFIINFDYTKTHLMGDLSSRLALSGSASLFERVSYFLHSYTLGFKRLYILLFELGILVWSCYEFRKNNVLKSLSWIGISTWLLGIFFISPFRRRYFGIVMMISLILTCALLAHMQSKRLKRWLVLAIALYAVNNVVGDIVFIKNHYHNVAYDDLGDKIRQQIPMNARVATLIQFWIPLSDSFTVTNIHDYPINGHQSFESLIRDQAVDYVVYSNFLLRNLSPTTGEASIGYDESKNTYVSSIETLVVPFWPVVARIPTQEYGEIVIYQAPKKGLNSLHSCEEL